MSTRHVQQPQQKAPVFQGLIKKNANVPFIFLNDENLVKCSPLCRVSDIKEEIKRLIATGDTDRLNTFMTTVFDNPRVIYIDGIAYALNNVMPTSVVDSRLETEVSKRIQDRDTQNADKDSKELLHHVTMLLHSQQPRNNADEETITAMDYARKGISYAIAKASDNLGNEKTAVFAMKYIPSYRIRYQSASRNANERIERSGVWQFPECVIATQIIKISGEGNWKIGFNRNAVIIYPNNYKNMYVFHGNGVCTSPMAGTDTEKRIMSLDFISGVYYFLDQVEYIITKGYTEASSPANGHIFDTRYDDYRVRKNGTSLVTCATCATSGSCSTHCPPITIDEEKRMWVEFKTREAQADVGGSLEAARGLKRGSR